MMAAVAQVVRSYQTRIRTSQLNHVLHDIFRRHAPPQTRGGQVKFYYATQTGIRPPAFTLFVNAPRGLTVDYQRYLVHQLRRGLGLENSPIQLVLRARREEKRLNVERNKRKRRKT